jgi:hypothetical protein
MVPHARHALSPFVVAALVAGCAPRPVERTVVEPVRARAFETFDDDVTPQVRARVAVEGGCEIVAHTGTCELTSVEAIDDGGTGGREVVARYRSLEPGTAVRVERRFRVSYLARNEEAQIAFVRDHAVVPCRWQTVTEGACPGHSPEVELPATDTSGSEHHAHHRHHRH